MKKIIGILTGATLAIFISAAEKSSTSQRTPASAAAKKVSVQSDLPPFASAEAMQAEFHRRFLASPGFGKSRILRPVFLAPTPQLVHNGTRYHVVPPDLIGLENDPAVYGAHEHAFRAPRTNGEPRQLYRARTMSALETNAVATIRAGQELVVTPLVSSVASAGGARISPELLVVGALRASESCSKCHQCAEGTLLGAFTYTLKPIAMPEAGVTNLPFVLSRL